MDIKYLMQQSQTASKRGLESKEVVLPEKIKEAVLGESFLTVGKMSEENVQTFAREMDSFYCDFSLTKEDTLKIMLASQLDASVYELELTKEQKRSHEELNFFMSMEEIYEYIKENSLGGQKEEGRLIHVQESGRIIIKVVSILGKKERVRDIFLSAHKIDERKDVYLQNVIKKISKSMIELRKQLSALQERQDFFMKRNQNLVERLKSEGEKLQFIPDKSDVHFDKFRWKEKRLTKLQDNTTYFNAISEVPINKTGISYFHLKIINSPQKNVIVGVGSKFLRGIQNAYTHPDFIGFYLYGEGYIWEKTNQRDLHLKSYPIENGAVITTVVDMEMGIICWQICRVRVAYAVIPLELKAKLLFPMVMLINVNDTVMLV